MTTPLSKPDGGPAFPTHHTDSNHGMTLRDYFAAKAMTALIAFYASKDLNEKVTADLAYMQADAMLKEREKP